MPSEARSPQRAFADTNLFLRYFTGDVPAQADAVETLLEAAEQGKIELVTTVMVVAEVVWTLESYYGLSKEDIRDKVLAILNTPGLEVEDEELLLQGAVWYAEHNVDFIDAYNAAWMGEQGLEVIYTFDRRHFRRFGHLEVRVPGQAD